MEQIGEVIRQQRKAQGMTQGALAAKVGMSRATISGIENNTIAEVGARKLQAILQALGYQLTATPANRRPRLGDLQVRGIHD